MPVPAADGRAAAALREGGGDGGKEKCRRKKNLVLSHNSIMFELWRGDG